MVSDVAVDDGVGSDVATADTVAVYAVVSYDVVVSGFWEVVVVVEIAGKMLDVVFVV